MVTLKADADMIRDIIGKDGLVDRLFYHPRCPDLLARPRRRR
jgi:hypothetical protein